MSDILHMIWQVLKIVRQAVVKVWPHCAIVCHYLSLLYLITVLTICHNCETISCQGVVGQDAERGIARWTTTRMATRSSRWSRSLLTCWITQHDIISRSLLRHWITQIETISRFLLPRGTASPPWSSRPAATLLGITSSILATSSSNRATVPPRSSSSSTRTRGARTRFELLRIFFCQHLDYFSVPAPLPHPLLRQVRGGHSGQGDVQEGLQRGGGHWLGHPRRSHSCRWDHWKADRQRGDHCYWGLSGGLSLLYRRSGGWLFVMSICGCLCWLISQNIPLLRFFRKYILIIYGIFLH